MSVLVVDVSVAAKWFLEENLSADARRVTSEGNVLHVPDFFFLEMDNILCKWVRRGVIDTSEAGVVRSTLDSAPFGVHATDGLRNDAYALANQTRRSMYDCLYLALAVMLGGRMVTADRRLTDAVSSGPLGEHVLWVADVP